MRRHPARSRLPFLCWWRRARRRLNRYTGARVLQNGLGVASVDAATVQADPDRFFELFVAKRRPCIIRGTLVELAGLKGQWWASPRARSLDVEVEKRNGPSDSFGKGCKVAMTFGEFLDSNSSNHYLTTQEIPDGQLLAPPLTALVDQLPLRPLLLRSLIPQSINMWMGRSDAPASSGLHHDFHDNL